MYQQKSYQQLSDEGRLYLVPTPIGNLEDMTFRAVQCLKDCDLILAEDTRHTQKLLNHFQIKTPQKSFHKYNTEERIPEILALISEGKKIAQVSDAGMPVISDPGSELVARCCQEGMTVIPLPGANASLTGLIASGLKADCFTFIGFLKRKQKERLERLETFQNSEATMMFYESPFRLLQTLKDCQTVYGSERQAVVVRELTKQYEEFNRGSLEELVAYFEEQSQIKGEISFYVAGNPHPTTKDKMIQSSLDHLSLKEQVDWWMKKEDLTTKEAIKKVAKQTQLKKQEVYCAYHELNKSN